MPELTQSFVVPFPRAEVWQAFHDLDFVAGCMPGASLDKTDQGDRMRGQMRVKLGPITAAFAGEAELQMNDADWSGVIHGRGRDQKNNSRARADVRFGLAEQEPGTRVDVTVDFTLTGTLAQFSRGAIVQAVAQRITDEFARNLAAAMEAQAGTSTASPMAAETPDASTPAAPHGGAPAPAHELRLFGVLWSLFASWLYRQVSRFSRQPRGTERRPSSH